jgi:1-deoxy-D-xylulose-5-phosphate reductoisomerase
MKRVALLGATGSIGSSTLDVIARHPDRYQVHALAAHRDVDGLLKLCARFRPTLVGIADPDCANAVAAGLRTAGLHHSVLMVGPTGLDRIAAANEVDIVVAAIVGAAGLSSTLAAAQAGKRILLANKESVVVAGALLFDTVSAHSGNIIPLDSEHNAVFQCLPQGYARNPDRHGIRRIVLTASGGPFRGHSPAQLATVTPEQAIKHPRWQMGRKISVDSASLMNKGLEVIEAHWLFGLAPECIDVVVHPESLVHSLVEYADGSMLAQLGPADMRTPIAQALAWPERIDSGVQRLDLLQAASLHFEAPDRANFRCLDLAYAALRAGGGAPTVLNAANEIAVDAFLTERLSFLGIADVIENTLAALVQPDASTLEALLDLDREARCIATRETRRLGTGNE